MKTGCQEVVTSNLRAGGLSCSEFKKLSEPEPRHPQEGEENRNVLLQVIELEGFAVAIFPHGAISLPGEFAAKLRELVGRKIGILSLDGIHIRDFEAEDDA
jgi:hypothetical protein